MTTGQSKKLTLWNPSAYMPPGKGYLPTSNGSVTETKTLQVITGSFNRVILSLCANHSAFLHANTLNSDVKVTWISHGAIDFVGLPPARADT